MTTPVGDGSLTAVRAKREVTSERAVQSRAGPPDTSRSRSSSRSAAALRQPMIEASRAKPSKEANERSSKVSRFIAKKCSHPRGASYLFIGMNRGRFRFRWGGGDEAAPWPPRSALFRPPRTRSGLQRSDRSSPLGVVAGQASRFAVSLESTSRFEQHRRAGLSPRDGVSRPWDESRALRTLNKPPEQVQRSAGVGFASRRSLGSRARVDANPVE